MTGAEIAETPIQIDNTKIRVIETAQDPMGKLFERRA